MCYTKIFLKNIRICLNYVEEAWETCKTGDETAKSRNYLRQCVLYKRKM